MKGKKNKKRRVFDSIRILVLLVAFSVLLYPTVSNYLYEKKSTKVVAYYDENVETLEEKEKEIIVRRYFENQTQTQVAQALGVSQVQISRLEKKILKQMRARL